MMVICGYWCGTKGRVCEYATEYGYCSVTGCMKNETETITTSASTNTIGKTCIICSKNFEIFNYKDERQICPECLKRLKKILYPEES